MSDPKVTVGIPTFNRSAWLRDAIESVLAQTYTSFRLIVSDNASDDDTPEVVRSFGDERIDYVRLERNIGSLGNINRLVGLADTEFLLLLPDDDILYPGHLQATVELLERIDTIGLVHTAFDQIDAQSRVIGRIDPLVCHSPTTIERRDSALERLMVSTWGICFTSTVYRTKAIVEAGAFRVQAGPFCDRELWMRIALDWDFGYVARPLVGQRAHPGSVTINAAAEQGVESDERERFRVYSQMNFERRIDFLDRAGLERQKVKRLRALADLQLLVDNANLGLPWKVVAARLADLVRAYPRIALHRGLWRLIAAELGGRRARSVLREVYARRQALVQRSPARS
jgi:glycosyltransferase involved in cell wall biosynthesis